MGLLAEARAKKTHIEKTGKSMGLVAEAKAKANNFQEPRPAVDLSSLSHDQIISAVDSGQLSPEQEAQAVEMVSQKELQPQQSHLSPTDQARQQSSENINHEAPLKVMATVGSATLAQPVSGLAGIASPVARALGITDKNAGDVVRSIQEALTFIPKDAESRRALEMLASDLAPISEPFAAAENALGDAGNEIAGPVGGAIGKTLPTAAAEAIPFTGGIMRAARGLKSGVPDSVNIGPSGSDRVIGAVADDFNEVRKANILETTPGTDEQLQHLATFQRQNIDPASTSRITQNSQQARDEFQLSRTDTPEGAELNQRLFDEAESIDNRFRQIVGDLGDPDMAGEVKGAITKLLDKEKANKRQAYRRLAELGDDHPDVIREIPIAKGEILSASDGLLGKFQGLPDNVKNALDGLMAKYGVLGDVVDETDRFTYIDVGRKSPLEIRGQVRELTIGNTEGFRTELNDIFDVTKPAEAAARREIMRAFDGVVDNALDAVDSVTDIPSEIATQAKKARAMHRAEKQAFEAKDFVNDLIKTKPGTDTPSVDVSQVLGKTMSKSTTPEDLTKALRLAAKAPQGREAIGNLQAGVLAELVDSAMTGGKLVAGNGAVLENTFNGQRFTRALNKFGRKKLSILLHDKPDVMKNIRDLERIGQLRRPANDQVQIGSYNLINKLMSNVSKAADTAANSVPIVGPAVLGVVRAGAAKGANQKTLKQATNLKIDLAKERGDYIAATYPRLAQVLAINPNKETE